VEPRATPHAEQPLEVAVVPQLLASPAPEDEPTADRPPAEPAASGDGPEVPEGETPAPEVGVPEGTGEDAPAGDVRDAGDLMRDEELLAAARAELSGDTRRGFETTLLASPEEQLDIARYFDEELVLIPRRALSGEHPRYFRLDPRTGVVAGVDGPPPTRFRHYRDFLDYEYERLPARLRDLRKSVLSRNEIYVFGALIPLEEWALVVGRRRRALADTGRSAEEVGSFTIQYVARPEGRYDVVVREIRFADGTRIRPDPL